MQYNGIQYKEFLLKIMGKFILGISAKHLTLAKAFKYD